MGSYPSLLETPGLVPGSLASSQQVQPLSVPEARFPGPILAHRVSKHNILGGVARGMSRDKEAWKDQGLETSEVGGV